VLHTIWGMPVSRPPNIVPLLLAPEHPWPLEVMDTVHL